MRILHTESSRHLGGQELRAIEEMAWFQARGHKVWLAAGADTGIGLKAQERGIELLPVLFRGSFNPGIIARLAAFCLSQRVDLLVTRSSRDLFNAAIAARLTGTPLIRYQHICQKLKDKWIYRLAWRAPNRIIAVSDSIRRRLLDQKLAPEAKITVLGEYVDTAQFHPGIPAGDVRARHGIPDSATLITQFGMIRPDKGQKFLALAVDEIVRQHPDCWFMFVGSPTQPKFMEELQETLRKVQRQDRIVFAGFQPDIGPYLAASDIVCLTSLIEAQSKVIPQAFALGKLVVASNVGGIPELIKPGVNGLLYKKGDSAALARAIHEALTMDAAPLRAAALAAAHELDMNRLMEKTGQVYAEVIG